MCVHVKRVRRFRVPHSRLNRLQVNTAAEQQRCLRMPKLMHSQIGETDRRPEPLIARSAPPTRDARRAKPRSVISNTYGRIITLDTTFSAWHDKVQSLHGKDRPWRHGSPLYVDSPTSTMMHGV